VAERWFSFPNLLILSPVPLLVAARAVWLLWFARARSAPPALRRRAGLVLLGYSGMAISIWPHIVPPAITIWEAAAPPASQGFALVGTLIVLPLILAYTGWSYCVFRGKVKADAGYHCCVLDKRLCQPCSAAVVKADCAASCTRAGIAFALTNLRRSRVATRIIYSLP
jgi:cytochrome bd-type quinol oxidase subunit 2